MRVKKRVRLDFWSRKRDHEKRVSPENRVRLDFFRLVCVFVWTLYSQRSTCR